MNNEPTAVGVGRSRAAHSGRAAEIEQSEAAKEREQRAVRNNNAFKALIYQLMCVQDYHDRQIGKDNRPPIGTVIQVKDMFNAVEGRNAEVENGFSDARERN